MAIAQDMEAAENREQGNITEPLLYNGADGSSKGEKEQLWMVYLSTFVAVCGAFEFGSCIGFSSPTQTAITEELNLTIAEFSLFGSILTFGAMIGAILSGILADSIGRKWTLRVSAAFCAAGWFCIYFAQGPVALDIGRLSMGFGMGVFSYVVPVFISEIAPKNVRGGLTTANQLLICCGVSVSFIIGTVLQWRALALFGLVPIVILLVGLFFIPESPRYLEKMGRHEQFIAALQKLRGKDADISKEAEEIKDYILTLERLPKATVFDLFQKRYLRSVMIGVGLMVAQQFGGINGVAFYVDEIFVSAGISGNVGTVTYAILQVLITGLGALLMDRAGRRPLLLISGSGLIVGCILTAVSFYLKENQLATNAAPALAVTGILVFISAFSIGMGATPWIIMSEIFPINVKGVAGSLATLVNWFGAWLVSYTFNFMMAWSSYGTFIIYAVVNVLGVLFIFVFVPETKGRSLEQIQAAINRSN